MRRLACIGFLFLLCSVGIAGVFAKEHGRSSYTFNVPILMYHYIRDPALEHDDIAKNLSVSLPHLNAQLDWLAAHGYHTIPFQLLASGAVLPEKPVILTFDDGYRDAYTQAFPALKAHGMTATFYVITGDVGKAAYVTWDQLKEMLAAGMEIAPHTVTHPDLRKLDENEQLAEIARSTLAVKKMLGVRISSFAYPYGKYDATSVRIVKSLHVPFAVTTHKGVASEKRNPRTLPRLPVRDGTDFGHLLHS